MGAKLVCIAICKLIDYIVALSVVFCGILREFAID